MRVVRNIEWTNNSKICQILVFQIEKTVEIYEFAKL